MKIGLIVSILMLFSGQACAANGALTISTPAKDSIDSATYRLPVVYITEPEATAGDLLVSVDGRRVDTLRQAKREFELEPLTTGLTTGKHRICLALNGKAQTQTGVESCVDVIAR